MWGRRCFLRDFPAGFFFAFGFGPCWMDKERYLEWLKRYREELRRELEEVEREIREAEGRQG